MIEYIFFLIETLTFLFIMKTRYRSYRDWNAYNKCLCAFKTSGNKNKKSNNSNSMSIKDKEVKKYFSVDRTLYKI